MLPAGDAQPTLWLDGAVDVAAETSARVEWAWPATGARGPLRFAFPPSAERRRLKLALRGVDLEATRLTIDTDIGPALFVDLRFGAPDPGALPLDDAPAPSAAVEVIVDLPPTTGAITLRSAEGERLLVRPTLRTPAAASSSTSPSRPPTTSSTASRRSSSTSCSSATASTPRR